MRNSTTFSLTTARGAQLRELSRLKGVAVSALVGGWIQSEFEALGTSSEYAPCEVSFTEGGPITLLRCEFFGDEFEVNLTPEEALSLAGSIRDVLAGVQATLNFDACGAIVQRHGPRGVQVLLRSWAKTMSEDVAREIATELADAAAEALRRRTNP